MKWFSILLLGSCCFFSRAFETRETSNPVRKIRVFEVENDVFRLHFNPMGGRLDSFFFKKIGSDLTNPETIGSGTENFWNVRESRFFLQDKPFVMTPHEGKDSFSVEMTGQHRGGGIDFLRVRKTYTLRNNETLLSIGYEFENMPDAMTNMNYAPLIHHCLGVLKEPGDYFYPAADGIWKIGTGKWPQELYVHRPARGWIAMSNASGNGIAAVMSFPELKCFYSWFSQMAVPTVEWRMTPFTLNAGETFRTKVELIAFTGIRHVAGAGGGFVGEIVSKPNAEPGDNVPLEVKVYNARSGKVSVELRKRVALDGPWTTVKNIELDFPVFGMVKSFSGMLTHPDEELIELEAILCKDGKEVARLNGNVPFGKPETKWKLDLLEKQKESTISEIDLTGFTNPGALASKAYISWAKPLAGKKPRVLVLTDYKSIPEVLLLAQRLDMDWAATYINVGADRNPGNPIWAFGDHFGLTTNADVENNLDKLLRKDYDVILIGGVPWPVFHEKARKTILSKVKAGTGLVYVGPDDGEEFLPVTGKRPATASMSLHITKPNFMTQGIPLSLLGKEAHYKFGTAKGAQVFIKAGNYPWLAAKSYGKGQVVAFLYRAAFGRFNSSAGLTPDLADRKAPFEFYYSLLAKSLLYAANSRCSLTFDEVSVKSEEKVLKFTANVQSVSAGESLWEFFTTNRYGECSPPIVKKVALEQGDNVVSAELPSPMYAGKQCLSAIVRDTSGNVINWGSWEFENLPRCALASIQTDKEVYEPGEKIVCTVKLSSSPETDGKLHLELFDSFGRLIDVKEMPGKLENTAELSHANALLSRCAFVRATVRIHGKTVDSMEHAILTRPEEKLLEWNDFEVGVWLTDNGPRRYLWKEWSDILRKMRVKTVIANYDLLETTYPVRNNFHPTLLKGSGLSRCAEPPEYAKTGDKMLLVRKPCLSEESFRKQTADSFEKAAKMMRAFSPRFYWLGDELSLTGYGGTPIDFCFSPACLAAFREFLKTRYQTLDKLNLAWESSFKTWDEVLPLTREEVRKSGNRQAAGWADHLEFMDGRLEDNIVLCYEACRKYDPAALFSLSGTQPPTAYGGMDWWRLHKVLGSLMSYNSGGQDEIHRSFCVSKAIMPWNLGYAGKGEIAVGRLWQVAFLESKGIMGFSMRSMLHPDWTFSQGTKDVLWHLQRLSDGAGKYMIALLKTKPRVAVLYSQASIRAAFLENRAKEHSELCVEILNLLRLSGIEFDFISYEQLEKGVDKKYSTVILPDSTALSDREIESLKHFAAKGALIAFGMPGIRESNCIMRKSSPLEVLFSNPRHRLLDRKPSGLLRALQYPDVKENILQIQAERELFSTMPGNFSDGEKLPSVTLESGEKIADAKIFVRSDPKGNKFYGIATACSKRRNVVFHFDAKTHLYNLCEGKYYGFTDKLKLPFSTGTPYGFVMLDGKITIKSFEAKKEVVSFSLQNNLDTVVRLRVFAPDGKEAEHYARNAVVKDGRVEYKIPFALNDPAGKWTVTAKEVLSGVEAKVVIER